MSDNWDFATLAVHAGRAGRTHRRVPGRCRSTRRHPTYFMTPITPGVYLDCRSSATSTPGSRTPHRRIRAAPCRPGGWSRRSGHRFRTGGDHPVGPEHRRGGGRDRIFQQPLWGNVHPVLSHLCQTRAECEIRRPRRSRKLQGGQQPEDQGFLCGDAWQPQDRRPRHGGNC